MRLARPLGLSTCLLALCLAMGQAEEGQAEAAAHGAVAVTVADLRTAAEQRMAAKDLGGAWLAVADWVEQAPADPAARLAEARLAAELQAPALVIATARRGLNGKPDAGQEQALLLLKARAHLQVGEAPAAWAAFSRVLAVADGTVAGGKLAAGKAELRALAERARWQAYADLGGQAVWQRFLPQAEAAAAAPQAGVSEVLRHARWLAQAGQFEPAFSALRSALGRWPQDAQVRDGLAALLLAREPVAEEFTESEVEDYRYAHAADRALVAAGPGGLASAALLGLWEADAQGAERVADIPLTTDSVRRRIAARNAARAALRKVASGVMPILQAGTTAEVAPGDAAASAAWETRMGGALREMERALGPARAADAIATSLGERISAQLDRLEDQARTPAGLELREAAELFSASDDAADGGPSLNDMERDFAHVTHELLGVQQQRDAAAGLAALQAQLARDEAAAVLAGSADQLSWGRGTPALWRLRSAAAERLHQPYEMLLAGARAFTLEWLAEDAPLDRELPAETTALQDKLAAAVAAADRELGAATTAWQAGDAGAAFAALERVVASDPANAAAWHARWRWNEAGRQNPAALAALRTWWRLDVAADADLAPAQATAAQGGDWDLLLSIAEQRLIVDPLDAEAHLLHATAALATRRFDLLKGEAPLLAVTQEYGPGALLWAMGSEREADWTLPPRILETIGTPLETPGVRLWRDYRRELTTPGASAADPAIDLAKDPAGIHHEFLAGRLTTEQYRTQACGGSEEPLAGWLLAVMADRAAGAAGAVAELEAVAADVRVPLPLRAQAANQALYTTKRGPAAALRAGDPWNGDPDGDDQPLAIAPGQEVMLSRTVDLTRWPAGAPVCVRAAPGCYANLRFPEDKQGAAADGEAAPRLFVAHGVVVLPHGSWPNEAPPIVDLRHCDFLTLAELTLPGSSRLADCDARNVRLKVPDGASCAWHRVRGKVDAAWISGTWRCQGGDFELGSAPGIAATGRWLVSGAALAGRIVPEITPGGQATWDGVRGDDNLEWPAEVPGGMLLTNCTVTAPVAAPTAAVLPLPAPQRDSRVLALPKPDAPVRRATSIDELKAALEKAQPGEICELAPGKYESSGPLVIPPGVLLRGDGCEISASAYGHLVAAEPGARMVSGCTIWPHTTEPGQKAVVVGEGAWLALAHTWLGGFDGPGNLGYTVAAGGRLRLCVDAQTDGKPQIDALAQFDAGVMAPSADSLLRTAIADHARERLWALAGADFPHRWAAGDHRTAARALATTMRLAASATGMSKAHYTAGLLNVLQPVLRTAPEEAPPVLMAITDGCDMDTLRKLLDPAFRPYINTYVAGLKEEAFHKGADLDSIYQFMLAFPVGSADHQAAMDAVARGLSVADARTEIAENKRKMAELGAKLAKEAEERARQAAQVYAAPEPEPVYSSYSGYQSILSTGSSGTYGGITGPSETQQLNNYRQKLDDRLFHVMRGY